MAIFIVFSLLLSACGAETPRTTSTGAASDSVFRDQAEETTQPEVANQPIFFTVDDFTRGGLQLSDGTGVENNNAKRMRTGYWPLKTVNVQWMKKAHYSYIVAFYDKYYELKDYSKKSKKSIELHEGDVADAVYIRFLLIPDDETEEFSTDFSLPNGCVILSAAEKAANTEDTPQSQGVQNLLHRAEQCVRLSYQTAAMLPAQEGDIPAGTQVNGVIYSSVREESLYVPNCVSFHSYMTALQNPNSYIYTRQSTVSNSKTYFGTVCSAFVSYCYNLTGVYNTSLLGDLECFERLEDQSPDNMQLGDMWLSDHHVRLITGITRDTNGVVTDVTFSHAAVPSVRTVRRTRSAVRVEQEKGYVLYRYRDLETIPYEESQWVSVGDEGEKTAHYNQLLSPRRGDRSNWPLGETVEVDILDRGGFREAKLYRGEEMFTHISELPKNDCLSFNNLPSGTYSLVLTDGSQESESVSFKVVDTDVSAQATESGSVMISFSSENAVPLYYQCHLIPPKVSESETSAEENSGIVEDSDTEDDGVAEAQEEKIESEKTYFVIPLTQEQQENGSVLWECTPGQWRIMVAFQTDYGIQSSKPILVTVS